MSMWQLSTSGRSSPLATLQAIVQAEPFVLLFGGKERRQFTDEADEPPAYPGAAASNRAMYAPTLSSPVMARTTVSSSSLVNDASPD
jgi:hypothetical protein